MRRNAYTYLELLVVIAVIGILVALLLPAVQAAREAVRRSACSQHVMQLVLATHNYEAHHNVYPPGTVDPLRPILTQPIGYHHSWVTQLLPYLDQPVLFQKVEFEVGVYHPNNAATRSFPMALLQCPSRGPKPSGYTDYAGVHSDVETPIDIDNTGVFFLNSRIRYDDLRDGSSCTMFFGEKQTLGGDLGWMSGTRATLRNTGVAINGGGGGGWNIAGRLGSSDIPTKPAGGEDKASMDSSGNAALISRLLGSSDSLPFPNVGERPQFKPFKRPRDLRLAVGGFASPHPGGSLFGFGDGSVRYISGAIVPTVYQNFAHRSDGSMDTSMD